MSASVANSFNKLLSQPKTMSRSRATGEIEDGATKLRRMILVEGIPAAVVCGSETSLSPVADWLGIGLDIAPTDMEDSAPSE